MSVSYFNEILWAAVRGWWSDRALSMGAAIAFYTLFALAPMLLTAIAVAGLVFGHEAARGAVVAELGGLIGETGAEALEAMVASVRKSGISGTAVGTVTFLFLATGAFVELQDSLNRIWRVAPPRHWGLAFVRSRLMSLAFVIGLGFLLMVSLLIDAAITAAGTYLERSLAGWPTILLVLNAAFALASAIVMFALIFKVLPNVEIAWRDAAVGAVAIGLMFTVGKFLIGFYLGRSGIASTFGAAASVVTLLLWIYYSSQIVLFGAEITKACAELRTGGKNVRRWS